MKEIMTDLQKLKEFYAFYKDEYVKCFDNIQFKIYELEKMSTNIQITDDTAFNVASQYADSMLHECLDRVANKDQQLFGFLGEI